MATQSKNGEISPKQLVTLQETIRKDPSLRIAINAVTRGNLQEIALNRDVLNNVNFSFSHEVENKAGVTDQKRSGTCWMYAELNWLRTLIQDKFNIEAFEFSHNYIMLYDKLEKANYFLEKMIELRSKDLDDRRVNFLLKRPLPDGGEWHMLFNIIDKYGFVPREVMPDTWNRENSRFVNERLGYKLREFAAEIRKMHQKRKSDAEIRAAKTAMIGTIYKMLVVFLGMPPKTFDWSYRDKDKKYHQEIGTTPLKFYKKYLNLDCSKVVTLASCPSGTTPFNKTYSLEYFQNMVGGREWVWLNLPVNELKKIAIKMLKKGEAVLFGCDVVQDSHSKDGILFHDLYDYHLVFQTDFSMTKKERLDFGQSTLTHSMVLSGVDLVNGKPVKWKIENSWGNEVGKKGYFIMSDQWFDEHVLNIVFPDKYLSADQKKMLKQKPVLLPPWHSMA
ncbi:C1 family peptidase [bacterium]|nr:C1 family peptidase [bacterium]